MKTFVAGMILGVAIAMGVSALGTKGKEMLDKATQLFKQD